MLLLCVCMWCGVYCLDACADCTGQRRRRSHVSGPYTHHTHVHIYAHAQTYTNIPHTHTYTQRKTHTHTHAHTHAHFLPARNFLFDPSMTRSNISMMYTCLYIATADPPTAQSLCGEDAEEYRDRMRKHIASFLSTHRFTYTQTRTRAPHTHTRTPHTHTHTYTHTYIHTLTHTYTHTLTHTHARAHTHTHTHMHPQLNGDPRSGGGA